MTSVARKLMITISAAGLASGASVGFDVSAASAAPSSSTCHREVPPAIDNVTVLTPAGTVQHRSTGAMNVTVTVTRPLVPAGEAPTSTPVCEPRRTQP